MLSFHIEKVILTCLLSTYFPCYVKFFLQLCHHFTCTAIATGTFFFSWLLWFYWTFIWIFHLLHLYTVNVQLLMAPEFYWMKEQWGHLSFETVKCFFSFVIFCTCRNNHFISQTPVIFTVVSLHLLQILCLFWTLLRTIFICGSSQVSGFISFWTSILTDIQGIITQLLAVLFLKWDWWHGEPQSSHTRWEIRNTFLGLGVCFFFIVLSWYECFFTF